MTILSVEIRSVQVVQSETWIDIPGLSFQLPAASPTIGHALVILNVPQPYAVGSNYPGLDFAIEVGSSGNIVANGGFTYIDKQPESFARQPTTLVVRVNLGKRQQVVNAKWRTVRVSTGHIDSFASLSAILAA